MSESISVGDKARIGDRIGEVIKIEKHGDAILYRIAFSEGAPQSFFSPPTEIEKVDSPLERLKNLDFDPAYKFDLLTRANQLSLAFEYDQLLSLSNSRTNMEPYQVECVSMIINAFRQRFLIADDVGLGKTIEAGMILKELAARGRANRVLIITPASLTEQWKREMKEKFDTNFWIYDSAKVKDVRRNISRHANPWNYKDRIITSIDYVRQDHVRSTLSRTEWDIIIFDEAHKLSKTEQGETLRYKLGNDLSDKTDSLLFLTATPHDGNEYRFYHLISLLDPYMFSDPDYLDSKKLNEIMIRRGKDRLINEMGRPVFKDRKVKTLPVKFTKKEMDLYNAVTEYVRNEYNMANREGKNIVTFAMVILQKRMVSSIAAIRESLKRRLAHLALGKAEEGGEEVTREEVSLYKDFLEDPDSLNDYEREVIERKLEKVSRAETSEAREIEKRKLKNLIDLAEDVEEDSKARELKEFVDGILEKNPDEKILIFTEYRDTLDYLRDIILKNYSDEGKVTEIHGGVPVELRKKREKLFKGGDVNIMLATDAAGEGINLQFCHLMVDYELPWNPNRIDQRIGRLHRYGQVRDVKVHNLLVEDTREGQIFLKLQKKIDTIEKHLGGRVSDVLGKVVRNLKLEDIILDSLSEDKDIEATERSLEEAIEERKRMIEKAEDFLMDLRTFDLEGALKVIKRSNEITFSNRDIENFVRAFFDKYGGKIEKTKYKKQYRIYSPDVVQERNKVPKKIERATFDKDIAKKCDPDECEFIAFGHPLLDRIIDYCTARDSHFGGGATAKRLNKKEARGVLFNYKVTYRDASGETISERIVPILANEDGAKECNLDTILFRGEELEDRELNKDLEKLAKNSAVIQTEAENLVKRISGEKLKEVEGTRKKRIDVKIEEARKYFEPKIEREKMHIEMYESRMKEGEDMTIAIRGAKRKKEDLIKGFEDRIKYLDSRKKVYVEFPELLNCALLV